MKSAIYGRVKTKSLEMTSDLRPDDNVGATERIENLS
jgi:hypothetical protein